MIVDRLVLCGCQVPFRTFSSASRAHPPYPAVAEYTPKRLNDLKPGTTYMWCVCGLSKTQPWCDGSHKPTQFKPLRWTVPSANSEQSKPIVHAICQCKYTSKPPYCDGTHKLLRSEVEHRQARCECTHSVTGTSQMIQLPDAQRIFCANCGCVQPIVT
ncbi:CDGSH iron-sulfur domain-containing protein 3 mitochondrial [Paragonimus heterotremus]|uniref:CDGSH iron-sulfur domain-containing protein 3 mitochondrial n=1 Tax=Paragonimus heterotremus TaxID=100268 RepID=A0A8J4WLQ3_9TREM|nr:CDGSH iron-sulfur domain-containing protein 3 mitochondrial [Paragonimus heterotremus]